MITAESKKDKLTEAEALPDYNLEDIALMIGTCVAIWGDGTLSPEEHELLLEFIKQSEPEVFERDWVGHRDSRDIELCRLEYMVWLLEHINGLKKSMLGEVQDEQKAQELAVVKLCDMYRDKLVSRGQETSIGPQDLTEYVQTNKRNLFTFLDKVSHADSRVSPTEEALISKVKWEMSAPLEKLSIQLSKLNTKGKVLFWLLIMSIIYAPTCWLPWYVEGCRVRNGQSLTVLNRKGLVAVVTMCLLAFVINIAPLWFLTWIPMMISSAKKKITLNPLS